jgi:3-oxoacyl-[acyl-carrier protein] reductase
MDLNNKTSIITGAAQGIGRAIALRLAAEGAAIVVVDIDAGKSSTVAGEIRNRGGKAIAISCDISSFSSAAAAVEQAIKVFDRVDILVNNAGINRDGVCWKMSEQQWDQVIAVNLKGYFTFTRHVAPSFKAQNSGKIVNISSINGLRGKFGQSNYAAAKAGIIGYTKTVARELGPYGVNVNAVAPGLIETAMLRDNKAREQIITAAMSEIVLKRIGQPEDLANAVAFLVSEDASFITGEVIRVDGGQYI